MKKPAKPKELRIKKLSQRFLSGFRQQRNMKEIEATEFKKILEKKRREVVFTIHSRERAEQRRINLNTVENNLYSGEIVKVVEQKAEKTGERKFDVYFLQKPGLFHRYVVCLNNLIRVITLMRVSRTLQKIVSGVLK